MIVQICFLAAIVFSHPQVFPAQHEPPTAGAVERFAERARTERSVGERVPVPDVIFKLLAGKAPPDYPECDREDRDNFETHQFSLRPGVIGGVAVKGSSSCYCSPTGNCEFWVFQLRHGTYRLILQTKMVHVWGFLRSRTKGYPDLVAWSHGSATDSAADLFRFDGMQYVLSGGWEQEFAYIDENGQLIRTARPRITSHFSGSEGIPEDVLPASTNGATHVAKKMPRHEQLAFNSEQAYAGSPIVRPVQLPDAALTALGSDERVLGCVNRAQPPPDRPPVDWFEASEIHLNGHGEIDLIVLPRLAPIEAPSGRVSENLCLLGANINPFWVLRPTRSGFEIILSESAHNLEVAKTRSNHYRDIRLSEETATVFTIAEFKFDGESYSFYRSEFRPISPSKLRHH
jgi:hypothetical protein